MPGDEVEIDLEHPDLIISFPEIQMMNVQDLGQFLEGFGDALERVGQLIAPSTPLVFRARIVPGSMEIGLFGDKKKTKWEKFRDANLDELSRAPAKVFIVLVGAGAIAGLAYLHNGLSAAQNTEHQTQGARDSHAHLPSQQIGRFTVFGPPDVSEIGHALSYDPIFCRNIGKAYEAIWKNKDIQTMTIAQGRGLPATVLTRHEIASARLDCKFRPRS